MAIEKNKIRVSRFDREEDDSPRSSDCMSSEEDDEFRRNRLESEDDDDDDEFNDADSGAGSDDFDLLELGETGAEFCQVGESTFSIPLDLYDLPDLTEVLSLDVWNDCLTEEERFGLVKFLPDMEMETYMRTLKDLFSCGNFHFGSPLVKLFNMLKGGLCEPRVSLYRQGLNFFQKRQHYHLVRKHHNSMVSNLCQIRDAWVNYRGYSIEEKLRVLNIMKTQRSLMNEKMEDMEVDSDSSGELGEGLWRQTGMDRKFGQRLGVTPGYDSSPAFEFPSRGRPLPMESVIYGKPYQKGLMKLPNQKTPYGKESMGHIPSIHYDFEARPGPYSSFGLPRQNKAAVYDSGAALKIRGQMRVDDDLEQTIYEVALNRDRNIPCTSAMDNSRAFKVGKKKGDEFGTDSFFDPSLPLKHDLLSSARSKDVNQLSDIKVLTAKPSKTGTSHNFGKKSKYAENIQQHVFGDRKMKHARGRVPRLVPGDGLADPSDRSEPFLKQKMQEEAFSMDLSSRYNNLSSQGQKWNLGRVSPDLNLNSHRGSSPQMEDRLFHSNYRATSSKEGRTYSVQNGGPYSETPRGMQTFLKNDETESDSSDQIGEDHEDEEDGNPLSRGRLSYSVGAQGGSRSVLKSSLNPKHAKLVKKAKKERALTIEEGVPSKKSRDFGDQLHMPETENYSLKAMQKGKLRGLASRAREVFSAGSASLNDDLSLRHGSKMGKNNQLQGQFGERPYMSSLKSNVGERRQIREFDEEDYSLEVRAMTNDNVLQGRLGKKGHSFQTFSNDGQAASDMPLLGCNTMNKKRKVKENIKYVNDRVEYEDHLDESPLSKLQKVKSEMDVGSLDPEASEPPVVEMEITDVEEAKPPKKPFTLITPTVHTGFSFSIIHLLSAVRMAMITPHPEDDLQVSQHLEKSDDKQKIIDEHNKGTSKGVESHENVDAQTSGQPGKNAPSLTVQEIVNRVRSNPGDPCILETQEPLQDLIRGVLKIFSSKTAPLGAKSWKPLASLEKSTKSWSWVGPISHISSDYETIEEVTSPEAWGLPHKMLVKLVDSFANWLKSGQETLQQIGSLPAPPAELTQFNLDEKDRFKDLRAQKSLITITPSSEEVRAYFRKEEVLRYSIPDRAFSYTALDGKKSIVAPLRRCGGKPTSKARDHFLLKRDRPPHVTILCLVRDAAARMPGSIGTRADVCTLIRDSQYIVEEVSDTQVNQIVSGALDRLHYERDPCVQFDGERKLWVYLHRDREEEDFEDDGTSSTKKWKRPKKDAIEQLDQGAVTVAYHGNGEQTGAELCSDQNVEASLMDEDKRGDQASDDVRTSGEDVVGTPQGAELSTLQQNDPLVWEPLGLSTNSLGENKVLCQENSTNEDFDDEAFGKDRPAGLIGAPLL